jgi:hypothetical protein
VQRPWRDVFGFLDGHAVTLDQVNSTYRTLARTKHPDIVGGSHDAMTELNYAKEQALRELGT